MKPPTCKLCKKAHWTYEEHAGSETEAPEYIKEMVGGATRSDLPPPTSIRPSPPTVVATVTKRNNVTPVTKPHEPLVGRPRKHKTNAERQRAYRERSK